MAKIRYYLDWLFKDLNERKGKYVIAEAPNAPLLVFMVCFVLGIIQYPGPLQMILMVIAYLALAYWGVRETKSGRSRFRKLLGMLGILAVLGAFALRLGI